MRKKSKFEFELPWQMNLMLVVVAVVAASVAVSLGWALLEMIVNRAFETMLASPDDTLPFSFAAIWPLLLLAFGILSIRFYLAFKNIVIRRISML